MYTMQNVKGLNNAAVYLATAHSMTVEEIKTEHIGHRKKIRTHDCRKYASFLIVFACQIV